MTRKTAPRELSAEIALNSKPVLLVELHAEKPNADGRRWIHLLPARNVTGIDGRKLVINDLEAIVERSQAYAGKRQMVLDYEHQTDLAPTSGNPAPAAGWIVGLQARENGIWGLVELTERAAAFIANREYRYVSPVLGLTITNEVQTILRASLTNRPNLDQLVALATEGNPTVDPQKMLADFIKSLANLLGLPDDTDAETITEAVRGLLTSSNAANEPDPTKWVPIGVFERTVARVKELDQGISLQAAQDHIGNKIKEGMLPPFLKDWGIALCLANQPAFDAFVAKTCPGVHRLFERVTPHRAWEGSAQMPDETTQEIALNMGLDPTKFAAFRARENKESF
ncbi:phage protease [Paradevosia shaoguanensis]|uniref:Phage protease n=1 Tax=Paradevosia shaoguanensis TaxID=1335043 RepID=A0AA41UER7_9HYPH|nr:phage protease [Paradevosia shaoguanensis]MCF1741258.1 phage protease [Paradevosia shaoguanensis]MCI0125741.1 phage protease [Paradevosia shaoguanensis]